MLGASGDFNVTRATTATRVNASGFIESVASGIPRLDYFASGGTVGCPALLVEPSAQNLAWHSETWAAGSNWNLSAGSTPRVTRVTGSTDAYIAPNGTFTANALSPTSGNVSHQLFSNSPTEITYTSGTIYTQSAFFKAGTGDAGRYVQLTFGSLQFTQVGYANFDLQVGAAVASGGTADANRNTRIENYGNGWYRCSFTATCNSTGTGAGLIISPITSTGSGRIPSFSGVTGDVLYGWGAQLETGSVATSYIPTTTGSVTRNADVVSVSGAVSGSIGQTEGTIYAEMDMRNKGVSVSRVIYLSDGTSNNEIRISHSVTTAGDLQIAIRLAGSLVVNQISPTAVYFGINKIAVGYKVGTNEVAMYVNGSQIILSTSSGNMPACNTIHLGSQLGTSNFLNDRIRAAALYNTRLTNAELAALTTP